MPKRPNSVSRRIKSSRSYKKANSAIKRIGSSKSYKKAKKHRKLVAGAGIGAGVLGLYGLNRLMKRRSLATVPKSSIPEVMLSGVKRGASRFKGMASRFKNFWVKNMHGFGSRRRSRRSRRSRRGSRRRSRRSRRGSRRRSRRSRR